MLGNRAELGRSGSCPERALRRRSQSAACEARAAAFISTSAGADISRLATEQDVDLILVTAGPALLDDRDLGELLRTAPCDVGRRRR